VVDVEWYGDRAIKVVYEDSGGSPQSHLLFRNEESTVEVADSEGPWSFDGDGAMLRLAPTLPHPAGFLSSGGYPWCATSATSPPSGPSSSCC
jgi:hypothetical protein